MIVIFVPSPPHLLQHSRVPAALPPAPPRPPCAICPTANLHLHTTDTSLVGLSYLPLFLLLSISCSLSFSFSLFSRLRRDAETGKTSGIPSRPVYSLLSLGPAHRRKTLGLLLRVTFSLTLRLSSHAFLVHSTDPSLSVHGVPRFLSLSAPRLAYLCTLYTRQ